ncbi:hypothetical protein GCM10022419_121350 [Nonomuraea rosea]|uniref:ESX-1 secretion-associated protein n=1 Tax=Nonomuraea rosea TaxID=638574 RepID=A0ABP6ZT76_9ACTN
MDTGSVDVSYEALDKCRTRVLAAAKEFNLDDILKEGGATAPALPTAAALFGMLDGAQELAAKMDAAWTGIRGEIESGHAKLEEVERALNAVMDNLRAAATASGA